MLIFLKLKGGKKVIDENLNAGAAKAVRAISDAAGEHGYTRLLAILVEPGTGVDTIPLAFTAHRQGMSASEALGALETVFASILRSEVDTAKRAKMNGAAAYAAAVDRIVEGIKAVLRKGDTECAKALGRK